MRFFQHARAVKTDHFRRYRTWNQTADLRNHIRLGTAGFRNQRGIGGYTVNDPHIGKFADLIHVSRVHKNLHAYPLCFPSAS